MSLLGNSSCSCVVIGGALAVDTANLLSSSGVPTLAIRADGDAKMDVKSTVEKVRRLPTTLKVIAFFANSFKDHGQNFLLEMNTLSESFLENQRFKIVVFRNLPPDTEPLARFFQKRADAFLSESTIPPIMAARMIKQKYFPAGNASLQEVQGRFAQKSNVRVVANNPKAPVVSMPVSLSSRSTVSEAPVLCSSSDSSPPLRSIGTAVVEKNHSLDTKPTVLSIVGRHGEEVQLDPRRIRPLPNNPRNKSNPGFLPESIERLGSSMRNFGQVMAAVVCPVTDDPNFDAQLIDGERRYLGSKSAQIKLKCRVREDVSPNEVQRLYLLSIVSNTHREPPTIVDHLEMIRVLSGCEYSLSQAQMAELTGLNQSTVSQYCRVLETEEEVQKEIGKGLTLQIGLLLHGLPRERQLSCARRVLEKGMTFAAARRYVLSVRANLGVETGRKRGRPFNEWSRLTTLTGSSIDKFGTVVDMPPEKLRTLFSTRGAAERSELAGKIRGLITILETTVSILDSTQDQVSG